MIFVFIFILLLGIYGTLKVTRDSVVNFLQKEMIQNARLGDLIPRPLDPNLPLSVENTKVLHKLRKKHTDKSQDSAPAPCSSFICLSLCNHHGPSRENNPLHMQWAEQKLILN